MLALGDQPQGPIVQEILINAGVAEIRVAVVEDGKLQSLTCERVFDIAASGGRSLVGDIVLGRVQRVLPAVQAAFVAIGRERSGFLGAREAHCLGAHTGEIAIGDLVHEGDAVLVQIIKDPIGEKGARLSASIAIPGRLCVLTPYQPHITVSRRIDDERERERLLALGEVLIAEGDKDLVAGAGYIFRTASIGASLEDVRKDARRLAQLWQSILAARKKAEPPKLLHRDLNAIERVLRDLVREDTARIVIDDAEAAEIARAYSRLAMPQSADRIVQFCGPGDLFDTNDLEADIEGLSNTRVALSSGGWITIEGTEALTAVDVNSGSFTHSPGLEDTGLAINLEAARELGRQIRLRGIGGLIVVDFMHMEEAEHMDRVLEVLLQSLTKDGVPVTISPMSQFGLVEITRKRVREPLVALQGEECPACSGHGLVRRADVVAMDVLRRVQASARATPGQAICVHAAPDVVRWIEEQGESLRLALAQKGAARVSFEADKTYSRERFDVATVV
ncbi:MAG: Rne/Rng family ribonuclease [Rhizomicrobium sp.]